MFLPTLTIARVHAHANDDVAREVAESAIFQCREVDNECFPSASRASCSMAAAGASFAGQACLRHVRRPSKGLCVAVRNADKLRRPKIKMGSLSGVLPPLPPTTDLRARRLHTMTLSAWGGEGGRSCFLIVRSDYVRVVWSGFGGGWGRSAVNNHTLASSSCL